MHESCSSQRHCTRFGSFVFRYRYRYRFYESKDKPYQGDLNTSLPGERLHTQSITLTATPKTSYCTSRRTASAAASIRSRARLLFCPLTPCPPLGPACPDLRVGAGAQRIRKASCGARRQAELPRLSARLARACAPRIHLAPAGQGAQTTTGHRAGDTHRGSGYGVWLVNFMKSTGQGSH